MIGYVLRRDSCGERWLFLGTDPYEVAMAIRQKLRQEQCYGIPVFILPKVMCGVNQTWTTN